MVLALYLIVGVLLYLIGLGAVGIASNIRLRRLSVPILVLSIPLLAAGTLVLLAFWQALSVGLVETRGFQLSAVSIVVVAILVGAPIIRGVRNIARSRKKSP